ncbi:MAG TPA: hypothetical protein VKA57_01275 [Solirubrobacteraceae bacterium]|nr:hypothetical protein [Solirubrobacteraceae bacterium]
MRTIAESPALPQSPTVPHPSVALTAVDGSGSEDGDLTVSERIGFWMYVAMGSFCAAVLLAAAMSALTS